MKYIHIETGKVVEVEGTSNNGNFVKVIVGTVMVGNKERNRYKEYGWTAFNQQFKKVTE
jgi:hypothetical protein